MISWKISKDTECGNVCFGNAIFVSSDSDRFFTVALSFVMSSDVINKSCIMKDFLYGIYPIYDRRDGSRENEAGRPVNPTSCTFVGKETKRSPVNANREIEFRAPLWVRHYRLLIKFAPFSPAPSLLVFPPCLFALWGARSSFACSSRAAVS